MHKDRSQWSIWAQFLHRWKVGGAAAFLLDAGGPLGVLTAQVLIMGKPFLNGSNQDAPFSALADLLEDEDEMKSFAAFLREENLP